MSCGAANLDPSTNAQGSTLSEIEGLTLRRTKVIEAGLTSKILIEENT